MRWLGDADVQPLFTAVVTILALVTAEQARLRDDLLDVLRNDVTVR